MSSDFAAPTFAHRPGADILLLVRDAEPHWADVYLYLGRGYERLGERGEALGAYTTFVERAPRRQAAAVDAVRLAAEALRARAQAQEKAGTP